MSFFIQLVQNPLFTAIGAMIALVTAVILVFVHVGRLRLQRLDIQKRLRQIKEAAEREAGEAGVIQVATLEDLERMIQTARRLKRLGAYSPAIACGVALLLLLPATFLRPGLYGRGSDGVADSWATSLLLAAPPEFVTSREVTVTWPDLREAVLLLTSNKPASAWVARVNMAIGLEGLGNGAGVKCLVAEPYAMRISLPQPPVTREWYVAVLLEHDLLRDEPVGVRDLAMPVLREHFSKIFKIYDEDMMRRVISDLEERLAEVVEREVHVRVCRLDIAS